MKKHLSAVLKKALVIILPLAALFLCSCATQEQIEQDPNVLDVQEYQPETIYIGSVLPLSGSDAQRGELLKAAQETAVDIINQAHEVEWDLAASEGLSGYGSSRIELVFRDCTENKQAEKEPAAPETKPETKPAADPSAADQTVADKATAEKSADEKSADAKAADAKAADAKAAADNTEKSSADSASADAAAAPADADTAADTEQDEAETVSLATQMAGELSELGVVALLGACDPDATAQVAQVAAEQDLPLLAGSAVASELTDGTTYDFGGWFQRVAPTVEMQSQLFFAYVKHLNQTADAGIVSVGLAYKDDEYGQRLLESFNAQAADFGLQVVARIAYQDDKDDLALAALRMMRNQPQAVFHYGTTSEVSYFAKAYAAARFAPQAAFCCSETFQDPLFISKVKETGAEYWCGLSAQPGVLIDADDDEGEKTNSSATDMISGDPELFDYINSLYHERTGRDMDNAALYEFSAVIVLAQTINAVGSTDPKRLFSALQEATFPAPYLAAGQIVFAPEGQNSLIPTFVSQLTGEGPVTVYRQ